jgi:cytoskeletal protein CcmA (bactofilin family)
MKGELTLQEDLIVNGTFEGTVIDGVHRLSIGTFGRVQADVRGQSADISGRIDGNIVGSDEIILRQTALVRGELSAARLKVENGTNLENAVLSGRITRAED